MMLTKSSVRASASLCWRIIDIFCVFFSMPYCRMLYKVIWQFSHIWTGNWKCCDEMTIWITFLKLQDFQWFYACVTRRCEWENVELKSLCKRKLQLNYYFWCVPCSKYIKWTTDGNVMFVPRSISLCKFSVWHKIFI